MAFGTTRRRLLSGLAGWASGVLLTQAAGVLPAAAKEMPPEPLVIITRNGRFDFRVEVARTPEQQQQGLMGRRDVPTGSGMLFDYGQPRWVAMWMKNTPASLDMIFIRRDGTVAAVAARTAPFSETIIPAPEPVVAVLEVAAGTAAMLGIDAASRVEHAMFATRH